MSEDVLTSGTPWPELADLDGFWDADDTPSRGVPRLAVEDTEDVDDDPTPVNAPRPVFNPTLPPPTTPPVAGPPPAAVAEPPGLPTGVHLPSAPPSAGAAEDQRRWPRRLAAAVTATALVAAGAFGWQWNEGRHDAASAARILPSEPVAAPDADLVEFTIDRIVDVSVRADLASGDTLAVVSGGLAIARTDDAFWTREAGADAWTRATPTFLARNPAIVAAIEDARVVTITDVLPAEVHGYLHVVDDRSADVPDVVAVGSTVIDVRSDGNVRQLTLRVDRAALTASEPFLARRLQLAGDDPVDIELWVDRAGVVWRMSAPPDVTSIGGEYRLVAATTTGPGPLDDLDPDAFVVVPSTTSPLAPSPATSSTPAPSPTTAPPATSVDAAGSATTVSPTD